MFVLRIVTVVSATTICSLIGNIDGAHNEDINTGGDETDSSNSAGAAYVFVRSDSTWSQQ